MITMVKYLFLKKNVKILNDFNRMVSIRNNIVNLINNDNYEHNITLLVDYYKIFICQNDIY